MSALSLALLAQLALSCPAASTLPPGQVVERVIATAQAESGLNPTALHDNTTGQSYALLDGAEAVALAKTLRARKHSVDAGLMQINDANWQRLGLTAESVFDPRRNVCAGVAVLAEAYAIERRVSCRYNTGRPNCANGYPEKIDAALLRVRVEGTEIPVTARPSRELSAIAIPINPFVRHGPMREVGFVPFSDTATIRPYAARSATPGKPDSLSAEPDSGVGMIATTRSSEQ